MAYRPSAQEIRSVLDYEPTTGIFTWKVPAGRYGRIPAGSVAGHVGCVNGYRLIGLGGSGKTLRASILAWLWMTGEWPTDEVDHHNRNRSDDRWDNLRLATSVQNAANRKVRSDSGSGLKGVYFDRDRECWRAKAVVNGKRRWLGRFGTREEAASAYLAAAAQTYGEFATAGAA